jgi:altronate hydrolase
MYERLKDDMDINCGEIIDRHITVEEMGQHIFNFILEIASGQKTKSERNGIGDDEFVPWALGATI